MADATFLNGKVLRTSLPVLQVPLEPDAPAQRRLVLPQGELAQFYNADEGIRYMAFIELLPGRVRGNHYHKLKKELVYVIRGEVVLHAEDIDSKENVAVPLRSGDLAVICTTVAHALLPAEPGDAIEYSSALFDPADIYRYPIV